MRFWQIKHAEDPTLAERVLTIEGRDSYERTDNYNVYGLFCFFALRLRASFNAWAGTATSDVAVKAKFGVPMTHAYLFELYQPLIAICMRSKSQTIKAMAFELTHNFAFLLSPHSFSRLCIFQTDEGVPKQIFTLLFAQLGQQDLQLGSGSERDGRQV